MEKPYCLLALNELNTDHNNWCKNYKEWAKKTNAPEDTFYQWWTGKEEMPLPWKIFYTRTVESDLDEIEKKHHGKPRGRFSSCASYLILAKKEIDKTPKEQKEAAKKEAVKILETLCR